MTPLYAFSAFTEIFGKINENRIKQKADDQYSFSEKRREKHKKMIIWARNNLLQVVICDWSEIHKQRKRNTWMAIEFFICRNYFASSLTNSKRKQIQCFLSRLHFQKEPLQKNRSHLVFHQNLFNKYNIVVFFFCFFFNSWACSAVVMWLDQKQTDFHAIPSIQL